MEQEELAGNDNFTINTYVNMKVTQFMYGDKLKHFFILG